MADNSKLKKCEVVVIKIEGEAGENVPSATEKSLPKEKEIAKLKAALKELQHKNKRLQMEMFLTIGEPMVTSRAGST